MAPGRKEESTCPRCQSYGEETVYGSAKYLLGEDLPHYMDTVHTLNLSREKGWTPTEWWSQPSKWVEAYWDLAGDISEASRRAAKRRAKDGNR
jgi:hypothetical protein